jgi:hypothetical protein
MPEAIPSGPWHLHLPVAYFVLALVPLVLLMLAWKDWKLAAEEKDPVGLAGVVTLAGQSLAATALPALVLLTWLRSSVDSHVAMSVVMWGCLFWLAATISAAVTLGRARRFTLPASLISLMLWGIWTLGA